MKVTTKRKARAKGILIKVPFSLDNNSIRELINTIESKLCNDLTFEYKDGVVKAVRYYEAAV